MDYINKNKNKGVSSTLPLSQTSNKIVGLRGTDVRSNVQKYSAVITQNGVTVQQINLLNLCTWNAQGATLLVETSDVAYPLTLQFLTDADQIQAQTRLTNMMNGQLVL